MEATGWTARVIQHGETISFSFLNFSLVGTQLVLNVTRRNGPFAGSTSDRPDGTDEPAVRQVAPCELQKGAIQTETLREIFITFEISICFKMSTVVGLLFLNLFVCFFFQDQ